MVNKAKPILFSAVLLITMIPAAAMANAKVYTGNHCTVFSGTGAVYSFAAIGNSSSGWLYMDCPGVNDSQDGASNGWIMVLDQNNDSNGNIRCQMVSVYHSSGSGSTYYWSSGYVYSSGWGSSWQRLNFGALGGNTMSSYYYSCRIPKNDIGISYIGEYYINE